MCLKIGSPDCSGTQLSLWVKSLSWGGTPAASGLEQKAEHFRKKEREGGIKNPTFFEKGEDRREKTNRPR